MADEEEPTELQDEGQKQKDQKQKKQIRKMPVKNGETIYKDICNVRIHQLALPRRWVLLYTYKNYRQFFESERSQAVKEKVQELFGMTPEQAELYFNRLRGKHKPNKIDLRALKNQILREKKQARKEAFCIFRSVINKATKYAYKHSPPLLVTPMLRMVSDHMLSFLAELHGVNIPKRSSNDNMSTYLISIADWCALFVSNIYYELEVETRNEEKLRLEEAALPCSESTLSGEEEEDEDGEKPTKLIDYGDDDALLQQEGEP